MNTIRNKLIGESDTVANPRIFLGDMMNLFLQRTKFLLVAMVVLIMVINVGIAAENTKSNSALDKEVEPTMNNAGSSNMLPAPATPDVVGGSVDKDAVGRIIIADVPKMDNNCLNGSADDFDSNNPFNDSTMVNVVDFSQDAENLYPKTNAGDHFTSLIAKKKISIPFESVTTRNDCIENPFNLTAQANYTEDPVTMDNNLSWEIDNFMPDQVVNSSRTMMVTAGNVLYLTNFGDGYFVVWNAEIFSIDNRFTSDNPNRIDELNIYTAGLNYNVICDLDCDIGTNDISGYDGNTIPNIKESLDIVHTDGTVIAMNENNRFTNPFNRSDMQVNIYAGEDLILRGANG